MARRCIRRIGAPHPFQITMRRFAVTDVEKSRAATADQSAIFDCLRSTSEASLTAPLASVSKRLQGCPASAAISTASPPSEPAAAAFYESRACCRTWGLMRNRWMRPTKQAIGAQLAQDQALTP